MHPLSESAGAIEFTAPLLKSRLLLTDGGGTLIFMYLAAVVLSCVVGAAFLGAGIAKVLGAKPMREDAQRFGFGYSLYRLIGALEIGAAVGLAIGVFVDSLWWLGVAAATGLVAMMVGALIVHVRAGDSFDKSKSAVLFGVLALAAGILSGLAGS